MLSNKEIMREAHAVLKGHWHLPLGASALYLLSDMFYGGSGEGDGSIIPSAIVKLVFYGVFEYGFARLWLGIARKDSVDIQSIFQGFSHFKKSSITGVLLTIRVLLWALLFIGPGLIIPSLYFIYTQIVSQGLSISQWFSTFQELSIFAEPTLTDVLLIIGVLLWTLLLLVPGLIAILSYSMTFFLMNDDSTLSPQEAIAKSTRLMYGYRRTLFRLICRFFGWFLLSLITIGIGFLWFIPYVSVSAAKFYDRIKADSSDEIKADSSLAQS